MYGYTAYKLYTPSRSFSTSPLAKHMHQRIILSHVAEIRSNKWAVCMYRIYKIRGNERVLSALDKLKATLLTTIGPNRTGYGQSRVMRLWQGGISPGYGSPKQIIPIRTGTLIVSLAIAACLLFKTQPHWGMYHQPLASALETQQKDFVAAFTALPAQHTYRFWFNMQQHTQI